MSKDTFERGGSPVLVIALVMVAALAGGIYFTQKNTYSPSILESSPTPNTIGGDEPATKDQTDSARYVEYTPSSFEAASDKKRVYFFHANWCPTCREADKIFLEREEEIPDDVVIFKTDYNTERDLKRAYGVTYQHTFVQVDNEGNELAQWSGGDIEELKAEIK